MRIAALLTAAVLCLAGADARAKASIRGLVTMGRLDFVNDPDTTPDNSLREANTHPGLYAGAVILATWSQLEPTPGHYDFTGIDAGLASVRAYNARNRDAPLVGKLRVFAGPNAPAWAKRLEGEPVSLDERGRSLSVGHFWSEPYRAAWRALQVALAHRYDGDPAVGEVAVSSCASSTAEPFVIPLGPGNLQALTSAGYSDERMEACLRGAIDDYAPWRSVALDYTFNPFRTVAGGRAHPAPGFAEQVMAEFRQRMGGRGVIANHGLTPQINPGAQGLIDAMRRLGPPMEFQTRSPNLDWDTTVQVGEQQGMSELEIWDTRAAGGSAPVSREQLERWRAQLQVAGAEGR